LQRRPATETANDLAPSAGQSSVLVCMSARPSAGGRWLVEATLGGRDDPLEVPKG
jgi:hypothetical protein